MAGAPKLESLNRTAAPHPSVGEAPGRFVVLDGWRGISIIAVLACHLLPLGPSAWNLNGTAGPLGMAIFFTLSGFLLTHQLLERPEPIPFYIRRLCRILPLAYLFVVVAMLLQGKDLEHYLTYFLFLNNYHHAVVTPMTSPLWSLCVEMHFYLLAGLIVALSGRRGLWAIPLLALLVTAGRVATGTIISIETHARIDEILVGGVLALLHFHAGGPGDAVRRIIARVHPLAWAVLFVLTCHPALGALGYARPYAAAAMIGSTLWRDANTLPFLGSRVLKYFADTSYALYVIHPIMRYGWLATGEGLTRYLVQRPVGFVLVFALAHLSTFYYEKRWIEWGRAWSRRFSRHRPSAETSTRSSAPSDSDSKPELTTVAASGSPQ